MVGPGRCSRLSVSFVSILLLSSLFLLSPHAAAGANPPIQYDTVMTRAYISSVDGAPLPCSLYVPQGGARLPVLVDLHAFGGQGGISEEMAAAARAGGFVVISPWGRNYHSFYMDGKDKPGSPEPCLVDDFTANNASGWNMLIGDQWIAQDDAYRQQDWSDTWKLAGRSGSTGTNCTASADIKALESSDGDGYKEYAGGLVVRRQANGDAYLVDLDCDNTGKKWVRVFKYSGWQWTALNLARLPDAVDLRQSHNLKVVLYEDTIEVHFDHYLAVVAQDSSFTSGEVALASFGARHEFDNVRVQNEMLYGEKDVLDTVNQCLEELRQSSDLADKLKGVHLRPVHGRPWCVEPGSALPGPVRRYPPRLWLHGHHARLRLDKDAVP